MADEGRKATTTFKYGSAGAFIAALAVAVGQAVQAKYPGFGEAATAGVFWAGSILAKKVRDWLHDA